VPCDVYVILFLTTLFGFGMGTLNFHLQQAVNATTVQVANVGYKLLTTVVSRVTHPEPVPGMAWLGYSISTFGIVFYTLRTVSKTKLG